MVHYCLRRGCPCGSPCYCYWARGRLGIKEEEKVRCANSCWGGGEIGKEIIVGTNNLLSLIVRRPTHLSILAGILLAMILVLTLIAIVLIPVVMVAITPSILALSLVKDIKHTCLHITSISFLFSQLSSFFFLD